MIFSDKNLSQKLERTEARSGAALVETRARILAASAAEWIEVAGAYAIFDGIESPLTQTFGLGLDKISKTELAKIEEFFTLRGAKICHEISPLADASLMPLLNKRGYEPIELSNVMFMPIDSNFKLDASRNQLMRTRIIRPGEEKIWAKTSAQGWASVAHGLSEFMLEFGMISAQCPGGFPFIAELGAQPIATGMLFIFDDVALLAGASTITQNRGQGAQQALLDSRLQFAKNHGCKMAMMCADPGSQSQRNAEKYGFHIAYTRTKWQINY